MADWGCNTAVYSSNALSNYTPNNTYNTFSNWISPLSVYSSNALSDYTLSNDFSAFSNWISPISLSNRLWTNNTSNVFSYCNVGIGTSNPAYPFEVVGTTQVGALNVGTTSFTSNSITMLNKATNKFTIGASNIEIDGNIITFKNNTPRIVCSNNGTANAQVILYRNQNFNTPNQSSPVWVFKW
jgi:hypothetical protein